jgi:hypothetical protein
MNAIYTTLLATTILILITVKSHSPMRTILGLEVATLMSSYIISIGCLLRKRLLDESLPSAAWSLGGAGVWINAMAVGYAFWAFFWSFWPAEHHAGMLAMNWTFILYPVVLAGSVVVFVSRQRRMRLRPMELVPSWTPR